MSKWPEKKNHEKWCTKAMRHDCNCGADGFNACHDAFMAVINAGEKEKLFDPHEIQNFNGVEYVMKAKVDYLLSSPTPPPAKPNADTPGFLGLDENSLSSFIFSTMNEGLDGSNKNAGISKPVCLELSRAICAKFAVRCPTVSELRAAVNEVFCKQQLGEISHESDMQTEIATAIHNLLKGEKTP